MSHASGFLGKNQKQYVPDYIFRYEAGSALLKTFPAQKGLIPRLHIGMVNTQTYEGWTPDPLL